MTITSMESLAALDNGTQVRSQGRRWTREDDFWVSSEFRLLTDQFRPDVEAGRVYLVEQHTGPGVVTDWNIGDSCGNRDALEQLPVGAVLRFRLGGGETASKQDDGSWMRGDGRGAYGTSVMLQEEWVLDSLPDGYLTAGEAPAASSVGQEVRSAEDFDRLPVGAAVRYQYRDHDGHVYTKRANGWYGVDADTPFATNGERAASVLGVASEAMGTTRVESLPGPALPPLGERFGAGHAEHRIGIYNAMPVGTVVAVPGCGLYTKVEGGMWQASRSDSEQRTAHRMAVGFTGVTVESYPVQSSTEAAPATPAAPVIEGLDPERVQTLLHEYLGEMDGLSSTEREGITEMLDALGLEQPEPERVDVNVDVEVSGTWSGYFDDLFTDHIGGGARVDNSTLEVCWTNSVTITVSDHPEDTCACEEVTEDMVATALREEGMDFSAVEESSIDFTCSCSHD